MPLNPASEEIHRRHTDQRGDEAIGGPAVEGQGVGHLLQAPLAEDRHPLAQRHGLGLIVGDIDGGCAQAVVEAADFALQLAAQGGFQVRERLIEEEEFGLADQGPAQGDALPLSAGELTGAAVQEVVDAQRGGGGADAAFDLRLGGPPQGEAEGEVAPDRQVGIERAVLEDHGDVALAGRQTVQHLPVQDDAAAAGRFQAGDHPQDGRLAAARGAHQHQHLAVGNLQGEVVHGADAAGEGLGDVTEGEGHSGDCPVRELVWQARPRREEGTTKTRRTRRKRTDYRLEEGAYGGTITSANRYFRNDLTTVLKRTRSNGLTR